MPILKKLNGLPAPLATNAVTMTAVKAGATTTAIAAVTTKTATTTVTTAKMTVSPDVTTTRRAQEADKATIAGLITRSTQSTPVPSTPMMLTLASYWTTHALSTRMPSTQCESAEA